MVKRVLLAVMLSLAVGACSNDEGEEAAAAATTITVENSAFDPSTVRVKPGDTVRWSFKDGFDHTVTADDASFDSGAKKSGGTFEHMFTRAATYTYKCTIHPSMTGTVEVSG